MWEQRAYRARQDIARMAAEGLDVPALHATAIDLVDRVVPAELTCWAAIDPRSLVISSMVSGRQRIPAAYDPLLAEAEYDADQPHRFATLAGRGQTVARLSDLPVRDRERSHRLRHVWRPLGVDEEIRVVFLADGVCWGAAGMVRAGTGFTDREADFLAAVAPALAYATRLAVRSDVRRRDRDRRPAVAVVAPDGSLRSATSAAQEWQDRIDEAAPGRFLLMLRALAVAARTAPSGCFEGRLRDAAGGWVLLHAGPLLGGEEDLVAVVVEPAGADDMVDLMLEAYGLRPREREICREVIDGRSTAEIAERLFISVNTVQDHLKSVFAKVGVRSRGSLVARLSGW